MTDHVLIPRWVLHIALVDHRSSCPYCRNDRQDLCRDEEFTRELEQALAEAQPPEA